VFTNVVSQQLKPEMREKESKYRHKTTSTLQICIFGWKLKTPATFLINSFRTVYSQFLTFIIPCKRHAYL
jgi:hypothetical protein